MHYKIQHFTSRDLFKENYSEFTKHYPFQYCLQQEEKVNNVNIRQNRLVTYKLQHYLYVAIKKDVTEINLLPRKDVHVHGYTTEKAGYKI